MKTIRLTQHEAAIMDWLLATPLGKKARGFTVVRQSRSTSLEVRDASDLLELVTQLSVSEMTFLGLKEPSILSLRSKVYAADVDLGEKS